MATHEYTRRAVKQEQLEIQNNSMDINVTNFGGRLSDKEKYSKDHMFLLQNSVQEYQTDLEVILEFLEEHYRQESGRKSLWPNVMDMPEEKRLTGENFSCALEQEKAQFHLSTSQQIKANSSNLYTDTGTNQELITHNKQNTLKGPERPLTQNTTPENTTKPLASITPAQKGRKLRLFHFLFEMLEDPKMASCVSWVPASPGVFCFSARNKERVAELWGQRKGNRMPMTYQKMSRALRNYARSGEITKVKKKLTYQFSVTTLITLKSQCDIKNPYGVK